MNNISEKVFTADVLVVGGGMSGLPAALAAKENGADVLVAERGYAGLAGQAPRGGNGMLAMPRENYDYDEYIKYVCTVGDYLNDQEALEKFAYLVNPCVDKLAEWGAQMSTDSNGKIAVFNFAGSPVYNTGINLYALNDLRKNANKMGVKFLDHTNITGLIKVGDKVCGAVGFDIYDGTFYIIKAKSVIVACGSNAYRATRMFTNNGDGNVLAFDAGAQMRNAEFNFIELGAASTGETIHDSCKWTYNQLGENIWDKYVKWNAIDITPEFLAGVEKEIREGRGPVYTDLEIMHNDPIWLEQSMGMKAELENSSNESDTGRPKKLFPDKLSWMARIKKREGEFFEFGDKPAMTFAIQGNSGFIRVDSSMRTTVKGLYSAGADTCLGSAINGAAPLPAGQRGSAFMYCTVTGVLAGQSAAMDAETIGNVSDAPAEVIADLKKKAYHGLNTNTENGVSPREIFDRIQEAVCAIDVIFRKSDESLERAIESIEGMKADFARLTASDWHELKLCREAENFVRSSEIMVKCSRVRKETRNFHARAEYPERDDGNWLKWVLADNVNGEIVTSTEDVPIRNYKFQPNHVR